MARVALAATGPVTVAAGRALARAGGNAIDVAVAAALAAMVSEPGIVSLGGAAYVTVWPAGLGPVVIDGNVEMPGRGLPVEAFGGGVREVFTDYGGGVTMWVGAGSVATPGAVQACEDAVHRYGTAPWADVVAPAARAVRDGYPLGAAAAHYLGYVVGPLYGEDPEAFRVVTGGRDGPAAPGAILTNGPLGDILDLVGRQGAEVLSTGEVGAAMADHLAALGGLVTRRDLAAYRPVERIAVRRRVGEWDLALNPPPAVGGPVLAVLLGELARRDRWGAADVLAVQERVLRHRVGVLDVASDLDAAGRDLLLAVDRHGLAGLPTSGSTVNVSAVDRAGNACAVTTSAGYGSGIAVPGTGILLNNALGEPELNRLGVHRLAPGTRLASNMAPTTGRADDGRVLAAGSPGADRITTALMQVLGAVCLRGSAVHDAVRAPRVHVRFDEAGHPVAEYESDPALAAAAAATGWTVRDFGPRSMYFGGVGIAHQRSDGVLEAAGDPRREADVAVL